MGQAKQRGSYEERKSAAIDRDDKQRHMKAKLFQRQASPKSKKLVLQIVALMAASGVSILSA